jgi:hypothetical protein
MNGRLTDPSGGAVVGAIVEASNEATNFIRRATTNPAGLFVLFIAERHAVEHIHAVEHMYAVALHSLKVLTRFRQVRPALRSLANHRDQPRPGSRHGAHLGKVMLRLTRGEAHMFAFCRSQNGNSGSNRELFTLLR